MAAVLPTPAIEFCPFQPDLIAHPIIPSTAYNVSHEQYSSAPSAMYRASYSPRHRSPDRNSTSQPCLSPDIEPTYSTSPPSTPPITPLCQSSFPLVSPSDMIVVLDYTPSEGEASTPVTVNLELRTSTGHGEDEFGQEMSLTGLRLRLIFGRTAVRTMVNCLPSPISPTTARHKSGQKVSRVELRAIAPSYSETNFPERFSVPLTIQAMDNTTKIVESFTFGNFTYWAPTTIVPASMVDFHQVPAAASRARNKRKRIEDDAELYPHSSPSQSPSTFNSPTKAHAVASHPDRGFKLVRTTNIPAEALNGSEAQPAMLEWVEENDMQHPGSLDKKWSAHELAVGRRLIRFGRKLEGNKLRVSCEVIPQEAYDEEHIVISCVYRQETRNCWFTSVDVIYLLERLVASPFSVEEKNRIRRNLEGFKPTTVSKTKGGFEMFFQRIMDFPPPKPRNIEKDVKVFPWQLLAPAIEKIISKYSVIPVSDSESSPSSQDCSSVPSSQLPRATKPGRSRSTSTNSLVSGKREEQSVAKTLKPETSHQSLHMAPESRQVLHPNLATHIPDPNTLQMPPDPYPFPGLAFPEDQWRRRDSIMSLESMPPRTHDYYPGHNPNDIEPLHEEAFSNPFASDVAFGSLSLGGIAHHGHGLEVPVGMHDEATSNSQTNMQFAGNFSQDIFESRRSSLAGELMYPTPSDPGNSSGNNDGMTVPTYHSNGHEPNNSPHDYLYAQLDAGSDHRLPLHDSHA